MSFIHLHLALSTLAMALILVILFTPKGRGAHGLLGRAAAAALMLTALSSFAIRSHGHFTALHLLSVATLATIPLGVWYVRHGRVAAHRRVMLINAAGLFVAATVATLTPGRFLHTALFG